MKLSEHYRRQVGHNRSGSLVTTYDGQDTIDDKLDISCPLTTSDSQDTVGDKWEISD